MRRGKRRGTGMHLRLSNLRPPRPVPAGSGGDRVAGPGISLAGAARLLSVMNLVLLRHGESAWNAEGLFTGWVDVGLSPAGAAEAENGGRQLASSGLRPGFVHTSVLTRAIPTAT